MKQMSVNEMRDVQLTLLRKFDALCREHGLRYYLAYGTMLGAVRHRGYIPWDDDIDVMMPRESYDRLESIDPPDGSYFIFPAEARSMWLFTKLCASGTKVVEPNVNLIDDYGVYIDVFPLDLTPAGTLSMLRYGRANYLKRLYQARYVFDYERTDASRNSLVRKHVLSRIGGLHGKLWYHRAIERLSRRDFGASCPYYADWSQVRPFSISSIPSEAIDNPSLAEFEGEMYPVPGNTGKVLERIYGSDWETPIEREYSSHGEAYWLADTTEQ